MSTEQATENHAKSLLLLGVFFVLFLVFGLWQILLIPLFQGPDEQVHYATVQYWAELPENDWLIRKDTTPSSGNDIRTWHFSEEIRETAYRAEFDDIKWQSENTTSFSPNSLFGPKEHEIIENDWRRYIDARPIHASGTQSLYYFFASKIEFFLSEYSIVDRFFSVRALSLCIGILTIILAYASARKLGWGLGAAIAFSSLVAFQPMFLATSSIINIDILLIFSFSFFFFGALHWLSNPNLLSAFIMITAAGIGIFTKGPGIILAGLLALLLLTTFYQRFHFQCREQFITCILTFFVLVNLFFIFTPAEILADFLNLENQSVFSTPIHSIRQYMEKTVSWSAFEWTSQSYWGNFGWLDAGIPEFVLHAILGLEMFALLGLTWFFFDKNPPRFLPDKRVLLFALVSIITLQFAIRFFDWRVFDTAGKIIIGTPGRYFLPNILPHMLLIVSGLGYWAGTRERFQSLLGLLAILIFLLTLYCSWFIILPRYYL